MVMYCGDHTPRRRPARVDALLILLLARCSVACCCCGLSAGDNSVPTLSYWLPYCIMEILIQYPYREECKSVETDEQAALDNGAKRQAEQVRHRRPAARRAAKILLPPTHPTEGYTMICNPTGLKIKSNSYGDRKYGETDKV